MIDPKDEPLSLVHQCALVGITRLSYYYRPPGESADEPSAEAVDGRVAIELPVVPLLADGPVIAGVILHISAKAKIPS